MDAYCITSSLLSVNIHLVDLAPWGPPKRHDENNQWRINKLWLLSVRLMKNLIVSRSLIDENNLWWNVNWISHKLTTQFLTLIYRSHIGQAPRYLRDLIHLPSSAISTSPLRSLDHHDLFVPQVRTSMDQTRAFAIIGASLWNQLLPSTRSTLLTGVPSASFRSLKTAHFSLGLSHWKRFWLVCTARSAI